jgi:hypothetical protein
VSQLSTRCSSIYHSTTGLTVVTQSSIIIWLFIMWMCAIRQCVLDFSLI